MNNRLVFRYILISKHYYLLDFRALNILIIQKKKTALQVLEYEYEPEMEDTYRSSMLKTFKKTLDDGFFPFIILDTINDKVKHFDQFWSAAKTKGFEVSCVHLASQGNVSLMGLL